MDNRAFQIQRMLANKLNQYKGKGRVEEEVILIKPYETAESTSTKSLSFIDKEIDNLLKHMKFVKSPTQTRIFQPPLHYQLL